MEYLTEIIQGQIAIAATPRSQFSNRSECYFTIKELAEFSRIKAHTIRMWERRFPFLRPERTEAGRRVYTSEQVKLFLEVCLLKQNGYRMSSIQSMNPGDKAENISHIHGPHKYIKSVHALIASMVEMDIEHFNRILLECVFEWGIHETIRFVLIPFSERIGIFDRPEKKNYRHCIFLVMELIRQKVYLAIESMTAIGSPGKRRSVLVLRCSTFTELPLLFLHYLIRKEGFSTVFLADTCSLAELKMICKWSNPDHIVTFLPRNHGYSDLSEFIKLLPVYAPGAYFISAGGSLPVDKNLHYYRHVDSFKDVIAALTSLAL